MRQRSQVNLFWLLLAILASCITICVIQLASLSTCKCGGSGPPYRFIEVEDSAPPLTRSELEASAKTLRENKEYRHAPDF